MLLTLSTHYNEQKAFLHPTVSLSPHYSAKSLVILLSIMILVLVIPSYTWAFFIVGLIETVHPSIDLQSDLLLY